MWSGPGAPAQYTRCVTPAQLRAYAAIVRLGSVKAAAEELGVTEANVSLHVGRLRRELDDQLFTYTHNGLAYTPGGLRLASRAVEILGLQDRTVLEVSQAGIGPRRLRLAVSPLFAEHCAPGLVDLFASRAEDLEVELSVRDPATFVALLESRSIDIGIGPAAAVPLPPDRLVTPFLDYEVVTVASADHPLTRRPVSADEARNQVWHLGPSGNGPGTISDLVRRLGVPERNQRIFQSEAAALDETKHTTGFGIGVSFAIRADITAGRLAPVEGPGLRARGRWVTVSLPRHTHAPATAEMLRFITTPRATKAMIRGAGVDVGRFKPSVHVTLWG